MEHPKKSESTDKNSINVMDRLKTIVEDIRHNVKVKGKTELPWNFIKIA